MKILSFVDLEGYGHILLPKVTYESEHFKMNCQRPKVCEISDLSVFELGNLTLKKC